MSAIKRYIEDVKIPIQVTCNIDCVNEIIYAEVYELKKGIVKNVNTIKPTVGDPNPSGLIKGAKKGTVLTVLCDFSKVVNPGDNYSLKFKTEESGVIDVYPLVLFAEDGYSIYDYEGQVLDPQEKTILITNGPSTKFLSADGNYYEINVPETDPDDVWDNQKYYFIDDPVLFEYNNITSWYASKVDNNLNNSPRILSGEDEGEVNTDFWTLITAESNQPVVKYVANTLFKQEFVIAVKDNKFYELVSATRPYFSVDFDAELTAGDWEVRGGGDQYILPYGGTVQTIQPSLSDFAGATVNTINNFEGGPVGWFFSKLITEVLASKASNKSVSLSGVSTQTVEVGTTMAPLLTATFNQGSIRNGNGTTAGALVGPATSYVFRDPSNTIITHTPDNPIDNSQQAQAPAYTLSTKGSFTWDVTVQHAAGDTEYYDNLDLENPDNNLSADEAAGSASDNSNTVTTRYYCWDGYGDQGTLPTNSAGVRALSSKRFMSSSDTTSFTKTIPAGTEEFSFYCIPGKTKTIIDNSNLNLPLSFSTSSVSVNDNDGQAVTYEKVTVFFGLGGRASSTNITVTVS